MAFATAMGAFGTAFTLATDIDVLPMVIYTEFTLWRMSPWHRPCRSCWASVTWALLLIARSLAGSTVAGRRGMSHRARLRLQLGVTLLAAPSCSCRRCNRSWRG
jgi:hypothetical protein